MGRGQFGWNGQIARRKAANVGTIRRSDIGNAPHRNLQMVVVIVLEVTSSV